MDQNANDLLALLQERLRQESLVKGIEDLNVGDIIYYDMDRADGIVPNSGYDTRLKYVVVAGTKSNAKEVCAVLINSDNDHSLAPDWQAEQYLIRQTDYPPTNVSMIVRSHVTFRLLNIMTSYSGFRGISDFASRYSAIRTRSSNSLRLCFCRA